MGVQGQARVLRYDRKNAGYLWAVGFRLGNARYIACSWNDEIVFAQYVNTTLRYLLLDYNTTTIALLVQFDKKENTRRRNVIIQYATSLMLIL